MLILPLLWSTLKISEVPITLNNFSTKQEQILQEPATSSSNNKEHYLPRRLYPGTYKNYCGPTPEVNVPGGCRPHGWHGDEALDPVDDACRLHDVSYCICESNLSQRKGYTVSDSLSSVVALRFLTRPVLMPFVDQEFIDCIHQADANLIEKGIQLRGEEQRSNCKNDGLNWFCQEGGTLSSFENVNVKIFLKNLDSDEKRIATVQPSLTQLENKRKIDLRQEMSNGKTLSEASLSQRIIQDEQDMLESVRKKKTQ
mmetsp:Transcript_16915/g.25589  ORF Transcript_16915/g.25589 Transcript_16915/m.25589 type:complete len:256 (-) Transcript_16915:148-915(-)